MDRQQSAVYRKLLQTCGLLTIVFTTGCAGLQTSKATHARVDVERVNNRSPVYPVREQDLSFMMNYTGYRHLDDSETQEERFFKADIEPKVMSMIDAADETIILSVFLLDNFYSKQTSGRDIVTPLVDKLVQKRLDNPNIQIAIILDPSNKAYGRRLSPAEKRFRENGIDVFYSDLLNDLDRASLLGFREGLGHLGRLMDWVTFRTWGQTWSRLFSRARLPIEFDGDPVSLETAYNAFLLKANHRKLLVADVHGEDMEVLVTTANPHNASAFHINCAVTVRGEPARFVYNVLREDMLQSARLGPLYAHWHYEADKTYRKGFGTVQFPALPLADPEENHKNGVSSHWANGNGGVRKARHQTLPHKSSGIMDDGTRVRFVSEREILTAIVELLQTVEPEDEIRIQMFYLSNRQVLKAILDAASRSQHPVRLLLDANKDSFNMEKDGTPNRQAARYLLRKSEDQPGQIEIRWYATRGEQNHAKTMSITCADRGRYALTTGSGNWTSRNLAGVNMEANIVVEGSSKINESFNTLFDLFWTNEDGVEYSLNYEAFADQTATDLKWRLGERPFYWSSF